MPELIVFVISISAVIIGAEWLGNASTFIAARLAIPRVIIGATVVSLATTLPEITISALSSAEGSPEVGLGTVFGSPFVNIGLIFGLLLLFSKPEINKAYFSRTIQFFLIAIFLVFLAFLGKNISPFFSLFLIFFGVIYLFLQGVIGKHEESMVEKLEHRIVKVINFFSHNGNYSQIVYLVMGSILLVLGAHFLVGSATTLAGILNVPQIVIGVVIIAFGTSLPEAFTTLNSIIRRRSNLSAGNLFGASILDLTIALGLGGIFNSAAINPSALYLTVGGLAIISSVSLLYAFDRISPKLIGGILIASYVFYLIWFSNIEVGGLFLF